MELDALIVADAVTAGPDGKFYMHGGGYSRFQVGALPAPLPLGILIRMELADEDIGKEHTFRVTFIGPTGLPNIPPVELVGMADANQPALADGEQRFVHIVLQLQPVAVREGMYKLEVQLNGEHLRTLPLPLIVIGNEQAQLAAQPEWPRGQQLAGRPASASDQAKAKPAKAKPAGKTKRPPSPPKRKRRR